MDGFGIRRCWASVVGFAVLVMTLFVMCAMPRAAYADTTITFGNGGQATLGDDGHIRGLAYIGEWMLTADYEQLFPVTMPDGFFVDYAECLHPWYYAPAAGWYQFDATPVGGGRYSVYVNSRVGNRNSRQPPLLPGQSLSDPPQAVGGFFWEPVLSGSLTVRKTIAGTGANPNHVFNFVVSFSGSGAPASQSFSLKDGEHHTIGSIPNGVVATVTEVEDDRYQLHWRTSNQQVIPAGQEVSFWAENERKVGSLNVKKELAGHGADSSHVFNFVVTFSGDGAPDTQRFSLRGGQDYTINNIPSGVVATVSEIEDDRYWLHWLTPTQQTIVANQTMRFTAQNERKVGFATLEKLLVM